MGGVFPVRFSVLYFSDHKKYICTIHAYAVLRTRISFINSTIFFASIHSVLLFFAKVDKNTLNH